MKIIIFGGSFDPPHLGHLKLIEHCLPICDKFIIFPAGRSPLKNENPIGDKKQRLEMLKLMIGSFPEKVKIDEFEFTQSGPSYTWATIQYLKKKYPDDDLTLILGADQLQQFDRWKNYQDIQSSVQILAFNRGESGYTPLPGMMLDWIKDFNIESSSSGIRKQLTKGELPNDQLPPAVLDYIRENNLYGLG